MISINQQKISNELLLIYEEQYQTYYKLYEEGNTFFLDYAILVCEQAIYTIHTYMDPSEDAEFLLAKMESLHALLKLALEKTPCDNSTSAVKSFQRFSKKSPHKHSSSKKNFINP